MGMGIDTGFGRGTGDIGAASMSFALPLPLRILSLLLPLRVPLCVPLPLPLTLALSCFASCGGGDVGGAPMGCAGGGGGAQSFDDATEEGSILEKAPSKLRPCDEWQLACWSWLAAAPRVAGRMAAWAGGAKAGPAWSVSPHHLL